MEIVVAGLLAVIAVSELYRTYLGVRPESKKEHFKRKLQSTRNMIWDLSFKVFKTREIREGIRQEYDFVQSRIQGLKARIEGWPKDGDAGELARVKDDLERAQNDSKRFLAQMKQLDLEVEGATPSQQNPEGYEGITMQIDNLRELETMLKDWIKTL